MFAAHPNARPCRLSARAATLLALGLALLLPAGVRAQDFFGGTKGVEVRSSPKFLAAFRQAVARPAESTVRVQCNGKDTALGVVVKEDGFILTAADDLEGKITVKLRDGKVYATRLIGIHEGHGLALLKIDGKGLVPVTWTPSKGAAVGDWVASPGPGAAPVAVGVVSVATRNMPRVKIVAKEPPSNGGYLGIGLADGEGPGAVVGDVEPRTPAARAGLKANDVILEVGGKKIPDAETLVRIIKKHRPGETVTILLRRGEEEKEIRATLAKRPLVSRSDFQNRMGSKLSKRRGGFPIVLQHDSVLLPEDCGGPLVDLDGKVVGVNVSRAGRVESYAIPSEVVRAVLPDLMSGRLAPRTVPAKK